MNPRLRIDTGAVVLVALLVAGLASGCGGDDDVSTGDLEGSWVATSFTVTSRGEPAMSLDAVMLGATLEADVDAEGAVNGVLGVPEALGGPLDLPFQATFTIEDQDTMAVSFAEEIPPLLTSFTGPFTLDGDTLTLTDENAVFDFGGGEVPATAVVVVTRQ